MSILTIIITLHLIYKIIFDKGLMEIENHYSTVESIDSD